MNRINLMFLLFLGLTLGGMFIVLGSFALFGFPIGQTPSPHVFWWKATFLVVVLAIPFGIRLNREQKGKDTKAQASN